MNATEKRNRMLDLQENIRQGYWVKVACNEAVQSMLYALDDELIPNLEHVYFTQSTNGVNVYHADGGTVTGNYALKFKGTYADVAKLAELLPPRPAIYAESHGVTSLTYADDARFADAEECKRREEIAPINLKFRSFHKDFRELTAEWYAYTEEGTAVHVMVVLPLTRIYAEFHPINGNSKENTDNWKVYLDGSPFGPYSAHLHGAAPRLIAYQGGHRYYFWNPGVNVAEWLAALDEPKPEPA